MKQNRDREIKREQRKKRKFMNIYTSFALIFLNSILLFVFINILLAILLVARNKFVQGDHLVTNKKAFYDLSAYTLMNSEQINAYLKEQDAMGNTGFQYKPWVQFQNPEFHGRFLNTDAEGFRRNRQPSSDKNISRIIVLGGSTTFGYGVADDYTIPSYMQLILEQTYENKSFLVKNYGQGFYYSSQELILFITLIKDGHRPDVAVFIDGLNDTYQLYRNPDIPYFTSDIKTLWKRENDYSWIPMVRLAKSVSKRFGLRPEESMTSKAPDEIPSDYIVMRYKNNIKIIRSICHEYNIHCIFVWQPIPFYKYNRNNDPSIWTETYDIMEKDSSPDFLYLGAMLQNVSEKVFVDKVHYNEKYNEEIAKKICAKIATLLSTQ